MTLNPKRTKKVRQHLRNNMTRTEIMLWSRLKGKQLLGYKVRRQYGIGDYVIDFYCPKLRLGIEIDGESHFTKKGKIHDEERDSYIINQGIDLIRVTTTEIYNNLDGVVELLVREFQNREDHW